MMTENTTLPPDDTGNDAGTEQEVEQPESKVAETGTQNETTAEAEIATKDDSVSDDHKSHTGRKVAIGFLIFLGAILLIVANFAFWARFTLLNTNGWVAAVGPITKDPQVANDLSTYVVAQLFQVADVNQAIQEILPDQFDMLSGPITSAVQDLVGETVTKLIMSDAFNSVWVGFNKVAHEVVIKVLSGQGDVLYMQSGQLTLDLSNIYNFLQSTLGVQNLDLIPQAQEGKLVLLESQQVAVLQEAYSSINTFGLLMPLLTFLAFGLAILVSLWRRTTLLWIGIATAIVMAISLIAFQVAKSTMFISISDPLLRDLARAIWEVVTHGYLVQTIFFLIAGILVAIGAWQAAPDSWFMQWTEARKEKKEAEKAQKTIEETSTESA